MPSINYHIEKDLHSKAKYKALELNMSLKDLIIEAITDFVDTK